MKPFRKNREQGIVQFIVVIIVAIIIIAYFRNDLQNLLVNTRIKEALLIAINWIQQALLWIVDKLGWTSSQIK